MGLLDGLIGNVLGSILTGNQRGDPLGSVFGGVAGENQAQSGNLLLQVVLALPCCPREGSKPLKNSIVFFSS
jgi:hypothetical protein